MKKKFKEQKVEVDGNHIVFDGVYDPETDTLLIQKYQGDVTLIEESMQNFCIDNGIGKVTMMM